MADRPRYSRRQVVEAIRSMIDAIYHHDQSIAGSECFDIFTGRELDKARAIADWLEGQRLWTLDMDIRVVEFAPDDDEPTT